MVSGALRVDLSAIFVSLELSRSKWLVTSLSPGAGERMAKFVVTGGAVPRKGEEPSGLRPVLRAPSQGA